MKNILIIEDDNDFAEIIRDMLEEYGYQAGIVNTCEAAYELLKTHQFHLILMDINLPDGTGFEICKELRTVSRIPVIFASARTSEDDKVTGLDIGGDDYLAKPYSLKEMLARVNALIRRTYGSEGAESVYQFHTIRVDVANRTVQKNGAEVKLALREFDLLAYLCAHPNKAIRKEELLREVWGMFSEAEIATVAVHIRWLREKLEDDPANPTLIRTVWGVGYEFCLEEKSVKKCISQS